jgi:hypothetical protein
MNLILHLVHPFSTDVLRPVMLVFSKKYDRHSKCLLTSLNTSPHVIADILTNRSGLTDTAFRNTNIEISTITYITFLVSNTNINNLMDTTLIAPLLSTH